VARPYGYASPIDAQRHVSIATWTASSKPNLTQIGEFITDASNELDGKLAALNYSTPVATGATQASDLLRTWTGVGAAYFAVCAMPNGDKHVGPLERRWTAILTMLDEGEVKLPGVSTDSASGRIRSASVDVCSGASPYFTRGDLNA
jgi:hypothetical protein